jgi:AraC-like DNA-binding protein/quercetin dioxygenase-like cupin family protein
MGVIIYSINIRSERAGMSNNSKISFVSSGKESLSIRVNNVGREQCTSLHKWGPGIRNFYLLHYVVSGKGAYTAGNRRYEIAAGSTFMIYPYTEISYCADKEEPWEYYWVGFHGNDTRIILGKTDFSEENPVIHTNMDGSFEKLLMEIYDAKGNTDSDKIKMAGHLLLALGFFAEHASVKERHDTVTLYTQKAAEYIEYNYAEELTVQGIADYIGISRSQLYRVFKKHYHKSPEEYVLEFRIEQACHLLKNSELSVGAVGYSVGFNDNLYFSKAFKKIKGISPTTYIKNNV